jgi:hypothetical protein
MQKEETFSVNSIGVRTFLKLLEGRSKAGATFFFRENAISIIKIPVGSGGKAVHVVESQPVTKMNTTTPVQVALAGGIREALKVLMTWYALRKFSKCKRNDIDSHDWDDRRAEQDLRTSQGFVWGINQ